MKCFLSKEGNYDHFSQLKSVLTNYKENSGMKNASKIISKLQNTLKITLTVINFVFTVKG